MPASPPVGPRECEFTAETEPFGSQPFSLRLTLVSFEEVSGILKITSKELTLPTFLNRELGVYLEEPGGTNGLVENGVILTDISQISKDCYTCSVIQKRGKKYVNLS